MGKLRERDRDSEAVEKWGVVWFSRGDTIFSFILLTVIGRCAFPRAFITPEDKLGIYNNEGFLVTVLKNRSPKQRACKVGSFWSPRGKIFRFVHALLQPLLTPHMLSAPWGLSPNIHLLCVYVHTFMYEFVGVLWSMCVWWSEGNIHLPSYLRQDFPHCWFMYFVPWVSWPSTFWRVSCPTSSLAIGIVLRL